jgi:hypothetical protein
MISGNHEIPEIFLARDSLINGIIGFPAGMMGIIH